MDLVLLILNLVSELISIESLNLDFVIVREHGRSQKSFTWWTITNMAIFEQNIADTFAWFVGSWLGAHFFVQIICNFYKTIYQTTQS